MKPVSSFKFQVVVLALYLALALVLTFPLVAHFSDHVPGTTTWSMDEYGYVWNNWWFKHAVFDRAQNPFETNFILYPLGTSLVLYTFTLLHVLLGLPIQFAFGLIPASNSELLFSFVVSGYGTFLLARYLLRVSGFKFQVETWNLKLDTISAFIAGALFAFSSNRFVYASLGHYNVVATEWIPFYILFLVKTMREPRWKNALLAGMFAAFAMYVETTSGVLMLLFTALYLVLAWRDVWQRATILRLVLLGATATGLFAPMLVPTISEIVNSTYTLPGWGHAEKLLVDLFGFFSPTSLHPLNRGWVQELDHVRQGNARFIDVNTVFLGYTTLALALIGAIRFWRTLHAWAISASVFAILALGPLLNIAGQSRFNFDGLAVTFPMPFLLLHYIPIIKENRVPNRFSILVMLSLAVLVSFAIAWLGDKVSSFRFQVSRAGRFTVYCLLLTVLLFEHAAVPLPLTDARVPDVYTQIAREPGEFAILTLPLGWRNSFGQIGAEDARVQYYQSVHQKFMFPANIQRNPPYLFDYFARVPIFHSITELEFYREVSPETRARDKALAPMLMTFFDVRYVVINPAIPGRPPYNDTHSAVVEYIQNVLPLGEKIYERDSVLAYRVNQAALPTRQEIRFGSDDVSIYQGAGWDRNEVLANEPANWINQREARIVFPLREAAEQQLTVRAMPFAASQKMELVVNDVGLQNFEMKTGWQDYALKIPARVLHPGINNLVLRFANLTRPRDSVPPNFVIGATGVTSPVEIVVRAEDQASIRVNGQEFAPQQTGYNVVVLEPRTGKVLDARAFDTISDRVGSRAFTDFIAQIPAGHIVAIASQDAVAANLGDRAAASFQLIGGNIDIRQNPSRTHTLIGVQGAQPGSAIEQSQENSSLVWVGPSQDARTLAAAVSVVVVEPE